MKKYSNSDNTLNQSAVLTKGEPTNTDSFFEFFQLIGNEDKVQIIELLRMHNYSKSELAEQLHKTPSTISHHIGILEDKELLRGIKQGKFIRYSLNEEKFKAFLSLWNQWKGSITNWE